MFVRNIPAESFGLIGLIIVNTSRGALINTADLIQGLKSGHIGAVGMDVYERESKYFFRDSSNKVCYYYLSWVTGSDNER